MNRDTETLRNGVKESQSYGATKETHDSDEVPLLAARVGTLQEAVQLSLKDGLGEECLFTFARALKAFELTVGRRLPPAELSVAFSEWWTAAKPLLPADADFDEWRFVFEQAFVKAKSALGSNALQQALRLASKFPLPPEAARYTSPKLKRLVAVCYHLQRLQGQSPFFISVRDTADITEVTSLYTAGNLLSGLVRDGILTVAEKGNRKRATRYWFNFQDGSANVPKTTTVAPTPTQTSAPNQATTSPGSESPTRKRKPTPARMSLFQAMKEAVQEGPTPPNF